ncbi:uncharacterized protein LOC125495610 [Beta vulgaris subsp. vulgaris]|uniref:uncharacterized protein LOC125495610 n=1 Tax=Beta vulgaris subsp. vulgaris TaxID=3555 RepID=UPI0025498B2B|nr:uncharacterized protein LOC125495610 [Beta vulgaris subsp. vulgaris]
MELFEDMFVGYIMVNINPNKRSKIDLGDDNNNDILRMIYEKSGPALFNDDLDENFNDEQQFSEPINDEYNKDSKEARIFDNLMRDAEQALYPGCEKFSKLSFILKLFQIKCMDGMTNKAFTSMLKMYKDVLPEGAHVPLNYYEARKMITDLGFDYEKIEACENDCMLFWKDDASLENCRICDTKRNRASPKILRYFPLKPRLQKLFMSSKTANDMRWHFEIRVEEDGVLKHPADGKCWKQFDENHRSFSADCRNVRLGLASDGFNPFGGLRSDYSIWPVVVVVYNLPPRMCMKQPYTILSLLIPGKSGPGNNLDVYLQPLIKELKDLWDYGERTYDASKNEYFQMHTALLWTINDFPAYANLSGWSTKGYKACPCCLSETSSMRLPNNKKCCYMDYRRFLPTDHKWRDSKSFNGKVERRGPPRQLSGDEILVEVSGLDGMKFGKSVTLPKRNDNWKKKSIFFELPYWSTLLLRHNLDVMHIEKNVCDNILCTLLDIEGMSKDTLKARHDLKCVNVMKHLAPKLVNDKWHIPPAPYTLSKTQKQKLCKFLEDIKVPDGYSSNISKCINLEKRKISGLKSHDCHVLMEQLLPLAIRGVSSAKVYGVIVN